MTSNGPEVRILLVKGSATNIEQVKANGYLDLGRAHKQRWRSERFGANLWERRFISDWCRYFGINSGSATQTRF